MHHHHESYRSHVSTFWCAVSEQSRFYLYKVTVDHVISVHDPQGRHGGACIEGVARRDRWLVIKRGYDDENVGDLVSESCDLLLWCVCSSPGEWVDGMRWCRVEVVPGSWRRMAFVQRTVYRARRWQRRVVDTPQSARPNVTAVSAHTTGVQAVHTLGCLREEAMNYSNNGQHSSEAEKRLAILLEGLQGQSLPRERGGTGVNPAVLAQNLLPTDSRPSQGLVGRGVDLPSLVASLSAPGRLEPAAASAAVRPLEGSALLLPLVDVASAATEANLAWVAPPSSLDISRLLPWTLPHHQQQEEEQGESGNNQQCLFCTITHLNGTWKMLLSTHRSRRDFFRRRHVTNSFRVRRCLHSDQWVRR